MMLLRGVWFVVLDAFQKEAIAESLDESERTTDNEDDLDILQLQRVLQESEALKETVNSELEEAIVHRTIYLFSHPYGVETSKNQVNCCATKLIHSILVITLYNNTGNRIQFLPLPPVLYRSDDKCVRTIARILHFNEVPSFLFDATKVHRNRLKTFHPIVSLDP
jgi:hypothetical protein